LGEQERNALRPAQRPGSVAVFPEVITAIDLPLLRGSVVSRYRKIRTGRSLDFALAGAAMVLDMALSSRDFQ